MSSLLNRFIGAVAVLSLSLIAAPASAAPTPPPSGATKVHRAAGAIQSLTPGTLTATAAGGNKINLSWTNPPEPDFVDLVITRHRADLSDWYAETPVLIYVGSGTSFQDRTAAQDVPYIYEATFRGGQGNSMPEYSAEVVNPSGLKWGDVKPVAPYVGLPTDISCPSASWCMAVDGSGRAIRHSGGVWGTPTQVAPARPNERVQLLTLIDCPTTSFCLAAGPYGSATYRSGTWSPLDTNGRGLAKVACASATRCVGLWGGTSFGMYNGTTWTKPAALPGVTSSTKLGSVSCPTTTFCAVTGSDGNTGVIATLTGTSWKVVRLVGKPARSLSCASASFCLATGPTFLAYRAGTWTSFPTPARPEEVGDLSCTSATACVGINNSGYSVSWNGSSWSWQRIPINTTSWEGGRGLDCASSSFCRYVNGSGATATFNGTSWTRAVEFDRTAGGMADVDCLTPSHCLASDTRGKWYRFNGTAWSAPWSLSTPSFNGGENMIDCVGTSWCIALGYQSSTWRTYSASTGTWGVVHSQANFYPSSLTCVDPAWCVASNVYGDLWRFDGSSWTKWRSLVTGTAPLGLNAVECQSRTSCVVVAEGSWARWYGNWWTTYSDSRITSRTSLHSCKTTTRCIAFTDIQRFAQLSGRTWSPIATHVNHTDMVCRTDFDCLGYSSGTGVDASIFDGRTMGPHETLGTTNGTLGGYVRISCPLPKVCAVYNSYQVSVLR